MKPETKSVNAWGMLMTLLASVVSVSAGSIVGIIDWDTPPATGWISDDAAVAVSTTSGSGGDGQWLRIDFDDGDPADVLVSGSAADLFAGTWRSEYWIEFDFWAETTLPDMLQVRWGAEGSTNIWGQTVTPSGGVGTWQTLRATSLGDDANWDIGLGDPSEYLADLSSIDWIGVYIDRGTTSGADSYGVDDYSLMVPEPAEIMMLAAAFGVGLLVWRRMRLVPVN